jgi:hypothetical protein
MQELQAVDRGRHHPRAGVPAGGHRPRDVDQVHDRSAEDEPERVGIVRQDDLGDDGERIGGALRRGGHAEERIRSDNFQLPIANFQGTPNAQFPSRH